jgi:lipopolysaccharide/colanic/teichoic acid biosynthesis glycosyltransferase
VVAHVDANHVHHALDIGWDELVVESGVLDDHPDEARELLRRAQRLWVVKPEDDAAQESRRLFGNPLPLVGRCVKRVLDIVLSIVGLLVTLPVVLLAMVAVRCETPGPAIFRQERVGANGRRFQIYKIRTMQHGNDDTAHREFVAKLIAGTAEACSEVFKLTADPRITRVGRVLRRFSIDELPQFWNVLKGDMSVVGPRPPLPSETELYSARAWERLRVKPGITGLWQVSGRCRLSFDEMVSLDVRYWERWTLRRDAAILLKTPKVVLAGKGAV